MAGHLGIFHAHLNSNRLNSRGFSETLLASDNVKAACLALLCPTQLPDLQLAPVQVEGRQSWGKDGLVTT